MQVSQEKSAWPATAAAGRAGLQPISDGVNLALRCVRVRWHSILFFLSLLLSGVIAHVAWHRPCACVVPSDGSMTTALMKAIKRCS